MDRTAGQKFCLLKAGKPVVGVGQDHLCVPSPEMRHRPSVAVVLSVRALFQNRKHQQEVEREMLKGWGDDTVPKHQWRDMEL